MSESKHTPGPWEIRFGGTTESDDGFCVASKVLPEFGVIAEAWPPNLLPAQRGAMLANARLIVAAPELLEAAEEFRDAVLHERHALAEMGMDSDQVNAVLDLFDDTIGNVIAKAKGEA